MNRWRRIGLVCVPKGGEQASHCAVPLVQDLSDRRWRVHYSSRDSKGRSQCWWTEFEILGGRPVAVAEATAPSLGLGRLGAFDDSGAMPGSLISDGDRLLLYYTGWSLGRTVPFYFGIGLAESRDGGKTFERVSEAPVLGRNHHDPFLTASGWVLKESGIFRMWYISATEWVSDPACARAVHYYTVKQATSADGILWMTNDRLCLPYAENEHALSRPVVHRVRGGYLMMFSARRLGETYRIYRAASTDGINWQRGPKPVIGVSPAGWDSEMVCYGNLLAGREGTFLLYNGNAYGRDGFGAAEQISE